MTVRMTEAQARLLFGDRLEQPARGAPKPRVKKRKDELPENVLEGQIKGLLGARGWTCHRNHVGTFIPTGMIMRALESGIPLTKEVLFRSLVRIGEKGIPDWRAERMVPVSDLPATVQLFYWEAKAPHKKPSPDQKLWMEGRRALGWLVEWFDDFDFGGSHSFIAWYKERFGE